MTKSIKLLSNYTKIQNLISVFTDLKLIDPMCRIKLFENKIMLYTMNQSEQGHVLALRVHVYDITDFFEVIELEQDVDYIIDNLGKVINNLKFFKPDTKIKGKFTVRKSGDSVYINPWAMSDGRYSFELNGIELRKMRDITYEKLTSLFDDNPVKWAFKINSDDFKDIITACRNGTEDVVSIIKDKDKLCVSEEFAWKLNIGETSGGDIDKLTFNKKYLYAIKTYPDIIEFDVYGTFFLMKGDNTYYMISYEKTY